MAQILRMVEAERTPLRDYEFAGETIAPPLVYQWRRGGRVSGLWIGPQNGNVAEAQTLILNITDGTGRNLMISGQDRAWAPVAALWRRGSWLPVDLEVHAGDEWLFQWGFTEERIADTGYYPLPGFFDLIPPYVCAYVDFA